MQITLRLKGFIRIAILLVIIVPCVIYFFYKSFHYLKTEAVIFFQNSHGIPLQV